jgi:hypothetical protein
MKAGAKHGSRDFHARVILAIPNTGHNEKALSENSFQQIRPPTALAEEQSCHGSGIGAAQARIRSGCPDLEIK